MSIAVDQWPRRHLIDVDQYYKMAEVGLLAPDARVELIEGEIIDMAPIGSSHVGVLNFLTNHLVKIANQRAIVSVQSPLRLGELSEPQPDLMLLKPRSDHYKKSHPTVDDVLLLIEVSDSTLKYDLGPKLALYSKSNIAEYWVIDLNGKQLHCMRDPAAAQYRVVQTLASPQVVAPTALPDVQVPLTLVFD